MLASGNVDSKITLYVLQKTVVEGGQFSKAIALEGHDDWVRSLAFATFGDNELCLASCSQDRYIRLWHLTSKILQAGEKAKPSIAELLENLTAYSFSFS